MESIGDIRAELGFDTGKAEAGVNKAKGLFNSLGDIVGPITSKFNMLELSVVGVAGAAVAAGMAAEQNMQKIAFATGAAGDQLAQLGQQYRTVGAQATESLSTVADVIALIHQRTGETGKGAEELADNLLKAAHALNAGDVHGLTTEYTALMNQWHIGAEGLDVLVKASQASGAPIGQLAAQLREFGPTFQMMGYGFEHSAALLANFERQGITSGRVIMAFKQAIAAEGGDSAEFGRDLKRMQELSRSGDKEGAINYLKKTMGVGARGMGDVIGAIRNGALDTDSMQANVSNSAGAAAGLIDKSFVADLERLKNLTELTLEPMGEAFLGIAEKIVPVVVGVEKIITPLLESKAAQELLKWVILFNLANLGVKPLASGIAGVVGLISTLARGEGLSVLTRVFGGYVTQWQKIGDAMRGASTTLAKVGGTAVADATGQAVGQAAESAAAKALAKKAAAKEIETVILSVAGSTAATTGAKAVASTGIVTAATVGGAALAALPWVVLIAAVVGLGYEIYQIFGYTKQAKDDLEKYNAELPAILAKNHEQMLTARAHEQAAKDAGYKGTTDLRAKALAGDPNAQELYRKLYKNSQLEMPEISKDTKYTYETTYMVEARQRQEQDTAKGVSDAAIAAGKLHVIKSQYQYALSAQERTDNQNNARLAALAISQQAAQQNLVADRDAKLRDAASMANQIVAEQRKREIETEYAVKKAGLDAEQAIAIGHLEARNARAKQLIDEEVRYYAASLSRADAVAAASNAAALGGDALTILRRQSGQSRSGEETAQYTGMIRSKQVELTWDAYIASERERLQKAVDEKMITNEERLARQSKMNQQMNYLDTVKQIALAHEGLASWERERAAQNVHRKTGIGYQQESETQGFGITIAGMEAQRGMLTLQYAFAAGVADRARNTAAQKDIDATEFTESRKKQLRDAALLQIKATENTVEQERLQHALDLAMKAEDGKLAIKKAATAKALEMDLQALSLEAALRAASYASTDATMNTRTRALQSRNMRAQATAGLYDAFWGTKQFGLSEQLAEIGGNRYDETTRSEEARARAIAAAKLSESAATLPAKLKEIGAQYDDALKAINQKYADQTWTINLDIKKAKFDEYRDMMINLVSNSLVYGGTVQTKARAAALKYGYAGQEFMGMPTDYRAASMDFQNMNLAAPPQPAAANTPVRINVTLSDGLQAEVVGESSRAVVDLLNAAFRATY